MSQYQIPLLDLKPQYRAIRAEIQAAIDRVLESGQFILGQEVMQFEQEVAAYLGVKHAVGVNSGTDALIIGLRVMGIGAGDEVITTPFSFFATAESISQVGAKPIFADISLNYNIDPQAVKAQITPRTKAIMPVHLFGTPAPMGQLLDIAQAYNLLVIEDCAQAFGARYYGNCSSYDGTCRAKTEIVQQYAGSLGQIGAFSFFPTKNLGAYGDAGLLVTNHDEMAEIAKMLRVHGAKRRDWNELVGYNSRLDALQAAILRVKLRYVDTWNRERRRVAQTYNQLLSDVEEIITPEWTDGHVFHQYTIRVLQGKRDRVKAYLAQEGIDSMVYYSVPQDRLPVYQGQYLDNPVSNLLASQSLSLPIWPELDEVTIKRIVKGLKQGLAGLVHP